MRRDDYRRARESAVVLRRLNERLEAERRRIAHALHDDTQQLLANVSIVLEQLKSEVPPPCVEQVDVLRRQLDEVSQQVRRLSHELRPTLLDDLGLVPALEFLAAGVSAAGDVEVTVSGRTEGRLPPAVETPLYRVVQEALANIARHARARRAVVELRHRRNLLRLSVRDDGVGFDVASALQTEPSGSRSLGLAGIRERIEALGGKLEIRSVPGEGSRIDVAVPLAPKHGEPHADSPADRRRSPPRS